jgi:hypothetical protein
MKSCVITNNIIKVNNKTIYRGNASINLDHFLLEAYQNYKVAYPKFHKMDFISKLGILTTSILATENKIDFDSANTGIIMCSKSGCHFTDKEYINSINSGSQTSNPALFTYTLPSIAMGEICIKHKIKGENLYLLMDKPNKTLLSNLINNMFDNKQMNHCVVGWLEMQSTKKYLSHFMLISKSDIKKYDFNFLSI